MLRFAFGFFLAMILSFVVTGFYLGYYKKVDKSLGDSPPLHLLGLEQQGSYHLANQGIELVEAFAKTHNIPCPQSFGMYFDDPEKVEAEQLRSFVGCVIDRPLNEVKLPEGWSQRRLDTEKSYLAEFDGSPALGPLKVYPEVKAWFKKNHLVYPYSLEIYQMTGSRFKTRYIFPIPINKVVPESLQL